MKNNRIRVKRHKMNKKKSRKNSKKIRNKTKNKNKIKIRNKMKIVKNKNRIRIRKMKDLLIEWEMVNLEERRKLREEKRNRMKLSMLLNKELETL
jgi:hypothetical protein